MWVRAFAIESGEVTEEESERLGRRELERWLDEPGAPSPSLGDLRAAFGISFDLSYIPDAPELARRLRLALAILRDVFPTDEAIRRWLRAPRLELGGERPLDLVLSGRADDLESCAIREWNRATPLFDPSPGEDSCP